MLTWIHFGNQNRAKMEGPIGSEGPNSCTLSALWGLSGQDRKIWWGIRFLGHLGTLLAASWGRLGAVLGPAWRLDRRFGPSWAVLARLGPSKNRCQNRSKNRYLSRSSFAAIFMDFGKENRGKLVPEFDGTSMSPSKGLSYEKYCKTN